MPLCPATTDPPVKTCAIALFLAFTWMAPAGFQVSALSQAESGASFTITTGDNSGRNRGQRNADFA